MKSFDVKLAKFFTVCFAGSMMAGCATEASAQESTKSSAENAIAQESTDSNSGITSETQTSNDFTSEKSVDSTELDKSTDLPEEFVIESSSVEESLSQEETSTESVSESKTETVSETASESEMTSETQEVQYTYTELNQTMYTTTALNVRSGPSTDYRVLTVLGATKQVNVVAQCNETGWFKIDCGLGVDCFVCNDYLSTEQVYTPQNTVDASSVQICQIDGYVNSYYRDAINAKLGRLPSKLLSLFVDSGWVMYVTDKNIDSYFYGGRFGSVKGTTNYDVKEIYIEDRDSAVETATVHEFGHFFDNYLGTITDTSDYLSIYYAEENAFRQAFGVNFYWDQKELFAEGFSMYFESPGVLSSNRPRLYNFIEQYVSPFT